MIRAIVFDLGGILLRLNRDEALRRFSSLGVPGVEELLDPWRQSGIFLDVELGVLSGEEFARELSHLAGKPISYEEAAWAYLGFIEEVQAYKFDFIDTLRADYKIYILSNTNPFVMEYAESEGFLPNGRKLSSYCDRKFASCEMGVAKPDREIFEQMLSEIGLGADELLFVDDGPANVAMGAELGMHTLCPENGADWREALTEILRAHR